MSLAFDDVGRGKPVVLLHAFPLCRAMWRAQAEALRSTCRLILPDLPGFGDSPLSANVSVASMADDVARLLDEQGDREPVVLGGLSMGGYVAFAFVRKYPDRLRGLILADTRAEADDETAKANRDKLIAFASSNPASDVVEQMLPKLLAPATPSMHPGVVVAVRKLGSAQKSEGLVAALKALRDRPDSMATLDQVRVPTLILVGKEDALTPPALAEGMAAKIKGARLDVIDGAGHLSNLERPAAFNGAVEKFLRSLE